MDAALKAQLSKREQQIAERLDRFLDPEIYAITLANVGIHYGTVEELLISLAKVRKRLRIPSIRTKFVLGDTVWVVSESWWNRYLGHVVKGPFVVAGINVAAYDKSKVISYYLDPPTKRWRYREGKFEDGKRAWPYRDTDHCVRQANCFATRKLAREARDKRNRRKKKC
jgi:hypothetical protein